jgi:transposase
MSSPQVEAAYSSVLVQENAQLKSTIVHLEALVDKLQYQLAQLTRRQFGVSAEGQAQLGLFLEGEMPESPSAPPMATQHIGAHECARPLRRPLPADLPREVIVLDLKPEDKPCPCCGEARHEIGEEVSEKLDIEPAKMTVLQYRRKKYACRGCEGEIQIARMPAQLIEQGLATPGLVAHVAVSKYCDHQPLARQEKIFARQGIELPRSTMSDWMLATGEACEPLVERMSDLIRAQDILSSDDTVLPYKSEERPGKTATARLWVWRALVQERAVLVYQFTEDRSGEHPMRFLQGYRGYLQADAYAGYDAVFSDGRIIEVGCMAHYPEPSFIRSPCRLRASPRGKTIRTVSR